MLGGSAHAHHAVAARWPAMAAPMFVAETGDPPQQAGATIRMPPPSLPVPTSLPTAPTKINTTGHVIALTAPLRDGTFVLGEIAFTIGTDDSISVNAAQLIDLLKPLIDPRRAAALQAQLGTGMVDAAKLTEAGFPVRYDAETISLSVMIPAEARTARDVTIGRTDEALVGQFDLPATFSGYVNFRTYEDYVWQGLDRGFGHPSTLIDGALNLKGYVLEGEGTLHIGDDVPFRRDGTRLVHDDPNWLVRFTAGDLKPISRGFTGTSQIAGFSVERLYSVLQPLRNIQPRGQRSFTLTNPSTVETFINGVSVRRLRLQPGTYNASDFPFAQGVNNVQLVIQDDAGQRQTIDFSLFYDRALLDPGLTEFGVYAGVLAPNTIAGRDYQFSRPAASGFIRRGLTESFTGGANFQVQTRGAAAGIEGVWASNLGTIGFDLATSVNRGAGFGYAARVDYQRDFGAGGSARSVNLSVVNYSPQYAPPSDILTFSQFSWELGAAYSQAIGTRQYASLSALYSIGRAPYHDEQSYRLNYGFRITQRLNLNAEASYENRNLFGKLYGVRLELTYQLGPRSSVSAEVDTRYDRTRIGYQTSHGNGVGAWSASGELDYGQNTLSGNGSASYIANRAELGISHSTAYSTVGSAITDQRTTLRFDTAITFADGSFALSRPVYDSFAMVKPHKTLNGADVYIEPRGPEYTAKSGFFGPAVDPSLISYIDRVVNYDVPNAPVGYDLGRGNIRVFPSYRSGYLAEAGSDYSVTALGTLVGETGAPVSLLAGQAIELARPNHAPITFFTNRVGRFGIQGLRPGKWRIEMPTEPPSEVVIDVPGGGDGLVRLGEVKLGARR